MVSSFSVILRITSSFLIDTEKGVDPVRPGALPGRGQSQRREDLPGVLGGGLHLVHGLVGVGDQGIGIPFVRRAEGHPEAPADDDGAVPDLEGLGEDVDDPAGDLVERGGGKVGENEAEFVASEPCQGVGAPEGALEAAGDLNQQLVPHLMPPPVVHRLESVQIQDSHGEVLHPPERAFPGLVDAVHEETPVGEGGEGVVEGHEDDLVFFRLLMVLPVPVVEGEGEVPGDLDEEVADLRIESPGRGVMDEEGPEDPVPPEKGKDPYVMEAVRALLVGLSEDGVFVPVETGGPGSARAKDRAHQPHPFREGRIAGESEGRRRFRRDPPKLDPREVPGLRIDLSDEALPDPPILHDDPADLVEEGFGVGDPGDQLVDPGEGQVKVLQDLDRNLLAGDQKAQRHSVLVPQGNADEVHVAGGASLAGDDLDGAGEVSALQGLGIVLLEALEVLSGAKARAGGKVPVAPYGGGFSVEAKEADPRAVGPDPPPLPVFQENGKARGIQKVGDPGGFPPDAAGGERHSKNSASGEHEGQRSGSKAQILDPAVVLAVVPESAREKPLSVAQDPDALTVNGGLHPEGSCVDPPGEALEVGLLLGLHPLEGHGFAKQRREKVPELGHVPENGVRGSGA